MSIVEARRIIEKAIIENKNQIDISSQGLTEIPSEILQLKNLTKLNISNNDISKFPEWLAEFENLESLDARNNNLTELFTHFSKLHNLKIINLRNNKFIAIPNELQSLHNLKFISLNFNLIEKIPVWFFNIPEVNIDNNPVIDPPIEVYTRGFETVKNYFKEKAAGTENLYEAKLLIVGEPGAGKTTLMNKILKESYELDLFEQSTKGIDIRPYSFRMKDGNKFRINIWDFGGQEIYHATHQFFLTKRSLYILLSDNRSEDTDFNYWLQSIELLSGNSPTIIVQNEKQDRKKDINISGMKERFSMLKSSYSFNLKNNFKELRHLKNEIEHQICLLPHIGAELPKIWVGIRKALEEQATKQPFISEAAYFDICQQHNMEERDRMYFLSDYLHDLGVFLHFRDNAVLKRWIILRPDWATEAVYKVLDSEKVISSNGYFTKQELKEIWTGSTYVDMHDELISLMMKFELCYQIENSDTYIAPQLLKVAKPSYKWEENKDIVVKYNYEFMPKGIITRFIVRMFYYISDQALVWREGVVLLRNSTRAEIVETYGKREIRIKIGGEYKQEFLAIVMDCLDKLHLTYHNLKPEKLIPCNCDDCQKSKEPTYFNFDRVRKFLQNNIRVDWCEKSLKQINLAPLIDDFTGFFKNNKMRLYLSSAKEDDDLKKDFLKHLKSIERNLQVAIVDSDDITVGTNEKGFIRDQLDTADIIVSLISSDYISSDWHLNVELQKAVDRMETSSCLFIPVILRDCDWKSLSIGHIRPVQYQAKPIFEDKNKIDTALTDAVLQIKNSINNFSGRKKTS